MCRKISGAPFMAFVEFPEGAFVWTQGEPGRYQSTKGVVRRFCRSCGGTLTYEPDEMLFISLGSLDHPERVRVESQCYTST